MTEWINVKDNPPDDCKKILLSNGEIVTIGYFRKKYKDFVIHHEATCIVYATISTDISHWMPLPEVPND